MYLPNKFFQEDKGSISVLVVSISFAVVVLMSFIGFLISGYLLANKLNNAADRVALSAGTNLISNPENVCDLASQVAISNEVELQFCEVNDDEVLLKVRSSEQMQSWLDRWPQIGMARAGIDYVFD